MATSDQQPYSRRMSVHRRWRRWVILGGGAVFAVLAVIVLALFQPWKLWVDDKVDEALPAGAVPITVPSTTGPGSTAPTTTAAPATTVASTTTTAAPEATTPATTVAPTTVAPTTVAPTTAPPTTVAPTTVAVMPVGGEFVSIDHGTSGMVILLQDATGTQFVRLENLDTSNGPDLFVYLSTNAPDGPEGQFDDDYVNLGRLEGNLGSSNYVVPPGTDLTRYASVVIWCDRFNSAFGAAPLA